MTRFGCCLLSARYSCLLIVAPTTQSSDREWQRRLDWARNDSPANQQRSANGLTGQAGLVLRPPRKSSNAPSGFMSRSRGSFAMAPLGLYVRRWVRWAGADLPRATSDCITTAEAGGPSQSNPMCQRAPASATAPHCWKQTNLKVCEQRGLAQMEDHKLDETLVLPAIPRELAAAVHPSHVCV